MIPLMLEMFLFGTGYPAIRPSLLIALVLFSTRAIFGPRRFFSGPDATKPLSSVIDSFLRSYPKDPDPLKVANLRTRTPAMQVQTLLLEGPRIFRVLKITATTSDEKGMS